MAFLVLGAGFTGQRVAARLLAAGETVHVTTRDPARLAALPGARIHRLDVADPGSLWALASDLPRGLRVLHSVPVLEGEAGPFDPTPALLEALGELPARVVYLSTTGVYGGQAVVDEKTEVAPASARTRLRVEAERAVARGPWSWMVLRPAAIYGPGRGVHLSIASGRYRLAGDGSNFVSRIHVDDLAAVAVAALRSDEVGAFPVADLEPARAREVAAFCAARFGLPMPPSAPPASLHETLRSDRRVDGRAIFRRLGVEPAFPTFREGIPAAAAAT
ncbi:NAD-dependent epimerase/dehydratase family protein [Vulgatibacter sp.]|uniref:NAD-dependent epimerase/dehydratase family protein n=1 Tax=Vulgatibacter sp. TaxID=1971226 RepID=UPI0035695F43